MDDSTLAEIKHDLLQWLNAATTDDRISSFYTEKVVAATAKNQREDNQDRVVFASFESPQRDREFMLLAVLDGMGGMLNGGHCAELAITSILSNLVSLPRSRSRFILIEALSLANEDIFKQYGGRGGTTFAGVFVDTQGARSVNVGDSRVYQFSRRNGLSRVSSDDRLGDHFAKIKGLEGVTLDPTIAERLGQHLGMCGPIRPNVRLLDDTLLRDTDGCVVISTDGVHALGDGHIFTSLMESKKLKDSANQIIDSTRASPNGDNATLICANLGLMHLHRNPNISLQEKLIVWSPQGLFTFVMRENATHKKSEKNVKSPFQKKEKKARSSNQLSKSPSSPAPNKETHPGEQKRPEPTVIIEQLTFEPINADESSA